MRPLALIASAALAGSALVGVPFGAAQAVTPDFTIGWDPATKQFRLVAAAGILPFAEGEELVVRGADETVTVVVVDGSHTIQPGVACAPVATASGAQVVCSMPRSSDRTRMTIDLRAATGATTTAVATAAASADPLAITLLGGAGPDYVQGGVADDEIDGGLGDDDLFGGLGNDKIVGNEGADNIDGEEGDDSLSGGPGNDKIVGDSELRGAGFDSMTGGPGVDELDSQDGLPDTYVNCDNAPGEGAIDFDRGLDIPYDCPVVLPPTAPQNFEAAGGDYSLTVSWAPPEFDGNATKLTYELFYRAPGKTSDTVVTIPGTESSYTLDDLFRAPGLYWVALRAKNEVGTSAATPTVSVVVGEGASPPQSVESVFERRWVATVSWVPPADSLGSRYELALRVMDKDRKNWLAWTPLPDKVRGTELSVGADLRIVAGRVYQFRVRTIDPRGQVSAWTESPRRFAGDLEPLERADLTGKGPVKVAVTAPGPAWRHNVTISALTASMTASSFQAMPISVVKVTGQRYSGDFPGPLTLTSGCWVGLNYRLPGATKVERQRVDIACPK
ncbi:MAG: hypothetical protein RL134_942 [Actinomycetota bacterium]